MLQRARHFVIKHTTASKVESSVLSATNYSRSEPRAECVAFLVQASHERGEREGARRVLECLQDRVEKESGWQPVLKALFVVHRLLQAGSDAFVAELEREPAVLSLSAFSDRSSGESAHYSKHIRLYCEYLEETLLVARELRKLMPGVRVSLVARRAERGRLSEVERIDGASSLLDALSLVQPHLDRLLRCERCARPRELPAEEGCGIACAVLGCFLRDGLHAYRLLSEGTMRLLNAFTQLPAEQAVRALGLYTSFVETTRQLDSMCDSMRRLQARGSLPGAEIPRLRPIDHERVVQALQRHVRAIDPTGQAAQRAAAAEGRLPSEKMEVPVVAELEQLDRLQAWSRRQFGERGAGGEREGELVSFSPELRPPQPQQPAGPSSAFEDMLGLESAQAPSAHVPAAPAGGALDLLTGAFDAPGQLVGELQQEQLDGMPPPPFMPPPPPPQVQPLGAFVGQPMGGCAALHASSAAAQGATDPFDSLSMPSQLPPWPQHGSHNGAGEWHAVQGMQGDAQPGPHARTSDQQMRSPDALFAGAQDPFHGIGR